MAQPPPQPQPAACQVSEATWPNRLLPDPDTKVQLRPEEPSAEHSPYCGHSESQAE